MVTLVSFEVRSRCEKIVCLDMSMSRKLSFFGVPPKLSFERGGDASFVYMGVKVLIEVRGL